MVGMIERITSALIVFIASASVVFSQEAIPSGSPTSSPNATLSPSPSPPRTVRISFVPPPLEGTISLGIYNDAGKLVRVLHQQASLDAFTIGADALETRWDGKDEDGQDVPPGKYHARGYAVGQLQVTTQSDDSESSPVPVKNDPEAPAWI